MGTVVVDPARVYNPVNNPSITVHLKQRDAPYSLANTVQGIDNSLLRGYAATTTVALGGVSYGLYYAYQLLKPFLEAGQRVAGWMQSGADTARSALNRNVAGATAEAGSSAIAGLTEGMTVVVEGGRTLLYSSGGTATALAGTAMSLPNQFRQVFPAMAINAGAFIGGEGGALMTTGGGAVAALMQSDSIAQAAMLNTTPIAQVNMDPGVVAAASTDQAPIFANLNIPTTEEALPPVMDHVAGLEDAHVPELLEDLTAAAAPTRHHDHHRPQ